MMMMMMMMNQNDQSIKTHLYSAVCRKRIRGACWAGLGSVYVNQLTARCYSNVCVVSRVVDVHLVVVRQLL